MTTTTGGAASVYSTLEMWLQTEWSHLDVHLSSVTDQFSTVAVVGPNARKLMKKLCQMLILTAKTLSLCNGAPELSVVLKQEL